MTEITVEPPSKRARTDSSEESTKKETTTTNAVNGFNAASDIDNVSDFAMTKTSIPLLPRDCKILLLDIEGCTTAISFVKDVLFPFVLSNLDSYLKTIEGNTEELDGIVKALKEDIEKLESDHAAHKEAKEAEKAVNANDAKEMISIYVRAMMNHDVKATGLKSLQGKIWKDGYKTGELKGHVYTDFKPMLEWCKAQNVSVNIYSSGSIGAQKLLFGCSDEGDLCSYFKSHFDTTSGGKKEATSYKNIAKDLGVDPKEICFISDAEPELLAAREAGIGYPVMSVRPGNAPLTDIGREFPIIFSLLQICGAGK